MFEPHFTQRPTLLDYRRAPLHARRILLCDRRAAVTYLSLVPWLNTSTRLTPATRQSRFYFIRGARGIRPVLLLSCGGWPAILPANLGRRSFRRQLRPRDRTLPLPRAKYACLGLRCVGRPGLSSIFLFLESAWVEAYCGFVENQAPADCVTVHRPSRRAGDIPWKGARWFCVQHFSASSDPGRSRCAVEQALSIPRVGRGIRRYSHTFISI